MRGPERKGEAFICRYSWIPHQVRNDREGISGFRVAPGHPAQRCGVHWRESPRTTMRGPERKDEAFICRYSWIPHQVRNDREGISWIPRRTGSPRTTMRGPFAGIPGYRVVARYDVEHRITARYDEVTGSSGVGHPALRCGVQCVSHPAPRCGVQCVSHPAQRCGVHWRVFLDTAS